MRVSAEREDQVHRVGEEGMLLAEMVHRTANEATAALAAIHLVRAAKGSRARMRLLDRAASRLEGFAAINTALAISAGRHVDVGLLLDRVIQSIAAGRGSRDSRIVLDFREVHMAPAQARRVLLVGYELVSNAMRHVIEVSGGLLSVILRQEGDQVILVVSDDGPGLVASSDTSGTGLGSRLVSDLVRCGAGRLECLTDVSGTTFRVLMPTVAPAAEGIAEAS